MMVGQKDTAKSLVPRKIFLNRFNQVVLDVLVFTFSFISAYFLRFEGLPVKPYLHQMAVLVPYTVLLQVFCFYLFSVYSIVWRFISITDAMTLFKASLPVLALQVCARFLAPNWMALLRMPLGVLVLDFMLVLTGTLGIRMVRRFYYESFERNRFAENGHNSNGSNSRKRTVLIGAGAAGNTIVKELKQRTDLGMDIVGFVDDDPKKYGKYIQGIKVIGNTTQILDIAKKHNIREAIITIANASSKEIRRIAELCTEAGLKVRIVPGLFEMLDEKVKITKVREINIDDLLGRSVFSMEEHLPEVSAVYRNKRILVTGAGGSIGSELCRQLSGWWPREIILLDKDENSIFEIDSELRSMDGKNVKVYPVITNIKNRERLDQLFKKYRPEVIFHAAAHKHVPLMELNVAEAVLNNIHGTKNVVELADKHGAERLIFISTDKAVNPTNVMGATKKIGEIIVQGVAKRSKTRFSCVRFGNVIGSRGSVVPLFQRQIAKGGPITVTHPDIVRYFMSIAEAVHLIIQAGTVGEKGEIFVLDMGKPIKITDIAKEMIRLSGYRENDIEIKYIGLRPGEKLFEEILVDEERAKATKFEKIYISPPVEIHNGEIEKGVQRLVIAAEESDDAKIIRQLSGIGIGFSRER